MKKLSIGILFGGKSAEHEVSLMSAKNVVDALDPEKYNVVLIGIDKSGKWLLNDQSSFLLNAGNPKEISLAKTTDAVALVPESNGTVSHLTMNQSTAVLDVVFPILHGTFGEDGTVQGLLKLANVPFVGASVLGSAVGMDKDVMKRLLRDAGVPIGKFITVHANDVVPSFDSVKAQLGIPCFVKPANAGSSVGVSKVRTEQEYATAIAEAFKYDRKILIEEFIKGREVECAVLGNDNPEASVCGEIIPTHEFYSYEAKYLDENGATLEIPANLPVDVSERVRALAIKTFKVLACEGMGRVDCFVKEDGAVFVNEINTIPGFTNISMYPKLWETTGLSYAQLLERLIVLAMERFSNEQRLCTNTNSVSPTVPVEE